MNYQRKRVAKRLASGLLAGALALGGLAISGASPASANDPSTPRISGINRFDTAVEIARQIGAGVALTNVIIASGSDANLADALGASALNTPILLTSPTSLSPETANFLSNATYVSPAATIRIVGGTSAVSDAVRDQIVGLGFAAANVTRTSGASRELTAIAISEVAGLVTTGDEIIIASGNNANLVDAVAASTLAAEKGWPILLANSTGLSTETQARLKAILATPGVTINKVHIIGGTSAVPSTVESQLTSTAVGLKASKLNRIAGADRYATAGLIAGVIDAIGGYNGEVALLNGTSLVDALVAGPLLAAKNWIPGLTPATALDANTQAQIVKAANIATNDVVAIGGATAIPNTLLASAKVASTTSSNLSPVFTVVENATSFTVAFSAAVAQNDAPFDCATAGGGTSFDASFRINGSLNTNFAGNAVTAALTANAAGTANALCTVTVARTAAFAAGTTIEFLGIAEGAAAGSATRAYLAGSTTVVDDSVAPTLTIAGIRDQALVATTSDGYSGIYFSASEALSNVLAAGEVQVYRAADAADGTLTTDVCLNDQVNGVAGVANAGAYLIYTCSTAATGLWTDGDDTPLVLAAGDVVVVTAGAVVDATGNASAAAQFTVALDTTKPVLTATQTVSQDTAGVIKVETGGTDITLTTSATGAAAGHIGNLWRIVLRNSAATVPSASVDAATRRVTLTFDFLKHDGNDILWAIAQSAAATALGTWAGGSAGLVAGYLDGDQVGTTTAGGTVGTSKSTITVTSDSPLLSAANVSAGTGATCVPTTTAPAAGATSFTVACAGIASGAAAPAGPIVLGATKDLSGNDATGAIVVVA